MASAPQAQLPLFYKDLMPLNSRDHGKFRARTVDRAAWVGSQHAVPVTVDEFYQAQRHFPIVFSASEKPVPLALMGLNENVNVFFDDDLRSPLTKEFSLAVARELGRGWARATYVNRRATDSVEDFITIDGGRTTIDRNGLTGTFDICGK